jgi:hypothetical protein
MKILLVIIFIWTLVACTLPEHKESITPEQKEFIPPADWKRINASNVYFYIPSDFNEEKWVYRWIQILQQNTMEMKIYG